jgi:hypothetical protein
MILTKALRPQGGSSRLIVVWTGTVARVVLIRLNQPLLCIKFPFQIGSLSATLSINTYQDDLGNLVTDNGIPTPEIPQPHTGSSSLPDSNDFHRNVQGPGGTYSCCMLALGRLQRYQRCCSPG